MRRRQFLGTLGTASLLGLAGCAKYNPFRPEPDEIPTDAQLEYIEFYPHRSKSPAVSIVNVQLKEEGGVYVEPQTFGNFDSFEIYTVKPDGSGSQLATLNREDYGPDSDARPRHTFDESHVSNGTILLILGVRPDNKKFTYGAFAKTATGDGLRQVAYTDDSAGNESETESNTTNSS